MLLKLLLAFTIIPLIELALLMKLSAATNIVTTIGIVIFTGVLGSLLARWQGSLAWRRFQAALAEGRMPAPEVQDGLLIFFAAGLLLTPGLLTDGFGFLMLIPQTRLIARRYLAKRFKGKFQVHSFGADPGANFGGDDANTIDAAGASRRDDP